MNLPKITQTKMESFTRTRQQRWAVALLITLLYILLAELSRRYFPFNPVLLVIPATSRRTRRSRSQPG